MVQIVTTAGPVLVSDEAITRVISRTSDYPYTHVWGPAPIGPLETAEDALTLVSRLTLAKPLARLTAPAGAPIWLKGSAVTVVRPATAFEHGTSPPFVNSVAIVGDRTQAMADTFDDAVTTLKAVGAHLPDALSEIATIQGRVRGYSAEGLKAADVFQLW